MITSGSCQVSSILCKWLHYIMWMVIVHRVNGCNGFKCFFVSCRYESGENMAITCSTKVCSFGKQVVEKVEVRGNFKNCNSQWNFIICQAVYLEWLCKLNAGVRTC